MPSGKEENSQRRGHPLRHELPWVRELRRGAEDLPVQVPRGDYIYTLLFEGDILLIPTAAVAVEQG